MTREEILAMEAGRELDGLVGKEIMGIDVECPYGARYPFYLVETKHRGKAWDAVALYSTDISAAWQVVEKMRENVSLDNREANISFGSFCSALIEILDIDNDWDTSAYNGVWDIMKDLTPEAICKAALLARLEVNS